MRILFLSRWFPYPTSNGSKLRIYNLLRGLAAHHEVSLLSFTERDTETPAEPALRAICETIDVVRWKEFAPTSRRARLGFFQAAPRSVLDTYSPEMAGQIRETLAANQIDLVIASQLAMAAYAPAFAGTPAIFEEVELGVFYEQYTRAVSWPRRLRYGLTWFKHRRYLAHLLRNFQACTVVSEQERRLLQQAVPPFDAVHVIPNCIDLGQYTAQSTVQSTAQSAVQPTMRPHDLIFTGSFRYHANYDAVTWFLQEMYPHIQRQVPEVMLKITGDHADLPLPPADNVIRTGFVDDIQSLIAQSAISIVPMRVGGGTRLKVLEAMALGTPVVSTAKGAEGLDVQDNVHLLIADTPAEFARAVVRVLTTPDLRRTLVQNAYRLVQEKYDWSRTLPGFLQLAGQLAGPRTRVEALHTEPVA